MQRSVSYTLVFSALVCIVCSLLVSGAAVGLKSRQEANALLATNGFTGIMRLDDVRQVEKIPVLGSGKTDYKVLRAQIK